MQCKGREGKKSRVLKVDVEVEVEAMTMRGIVNQPNQPAHYTNQLQGSNILVFEVLDPLGQNI